jgi:hypothetical protein
MRILLLCEMFYKYFGYFHLVNKESNYVSNVGDVAYIMTVPSSRRNIKRKGYLYSLPDILSERGHIDAEMEYVNP